jgi:hypothetical protein
MKIRIEQPTEEHLQYLAWNLREIDIKEMWLMHRYTPRVALKAGAQLSDKCFVATADGTPVLIFGVEGEGLSDRASIWMLATNQITKIGKSVIKRSKAILLDLINDYDMVYNYVYEKNQIALRWLKWLGFTIHEAQPAGAEGALFHLVEYRRKK